MSQNSLLAVEQLEYFFGTRRAVAGVSFEVREGEIFGLLGPNGAGKSTTLSCISGLLANWRGNLKFHDRPFHPARDIVDRRALGVVPQDLAIYDTLSGRENLKLFAKLAGMAASEIDARVDEQLDVAGLTSRQHDRVSEYSGGMKRRLNLAIGLLHHPELVLLDEPTVGVDPQSRNHLFESLEKVKAKGTTILYTTHYMEEAQRLCDRIAIMNDGQIVAVGTASELADQVGDPAANLEYIFLHLTGRSLRDA